MNTLSQSYSGSEGETRSNSQRNLEAFDVLFSRYRRVLSLVAYRVLDNHEEAEDAVQNCLLTASSSVPQFEDESAFRSWLVRVLIDEALAIRYADRIGSTTSSEPILDSLKFSPPKNGEQCNSTSRNRRWPLLSPSSGPARRTDRAQSTGFSRWRKHRRADCSSQNK